MSIFSNFFEKSVTAIGNFFKWVVAAPSNLYLYFRGSAEKKSDSFTRLDASTRSDPPPRPVAPARSNASTTSKQHDIYKHFDESDKPESTSGLIPFRGLFYSWDKYQERAYKKPDAPIPPAPKELFKEASRFTAAKKPDGVALFNGEVAGRNQKTFLHKAPKPGKTSTNSRHWIAKNQPAEETAREIIMGEAFRIMLGNDAAPKYRVMKTESNSVLSLSRTLLNFNQFFYEGVRSTDLASSINETLLNNPGIEYMLAVAILFAKDDMHTGNWGMVNTPNGLIASTVDHGKTLAGLSLKDAMYGYVCKHGFRKELIVNRNFIKACEDAIAHFDRNEGAIKQACQQGILAATKAFGSRVCINVEDAMAIIHKRREEMADLMTHIKCELAVIENNPEELKLNASKFSADYRGFGIFSFQSNRDGHYNANTDIETMINAQHTNLERLKHGNVYNSAQGPDAAQQALLTAYQEGVAESEYGKTLSRSDFNNN